MTQSSTDVAALFLSHQARIYGFISSLVPNRADAEDLLQETGLVVLSQADKFQPDTNFYAWACQIAHNKVLNFRTRQSRSPLQFGEVFVSALAQYQIERVDGETSDRYSALLACLEKLSKKDRLLVERCYASQVTIKQVAEMDNRPANVIYKKLRHIRDLLRDCVRKTVADEVRS